MVSFVRKHHSHDQPAEEHPVVRQYRFLLRQGPVDAVEAAHGEALARLQEEQRQLVLAAVRRGLVAGERLQPHHTAQLARLIVLGERRSPNAFLSACEPGTLVTLAQAVTRSEACFGLFGSYAAWDGADPDPEEPSAWADGGFDPDTGRWHPAPGGKVQESGHIDPFSGRGVPHKRRGP